MKKLGLLLTLLLVMAMGSHRVYAQSVTITLMPGWNWISVPLMDTLDFEMAMGSVTPAVGDIIKSRWGAATYTSDGQWRGTISQFYPGYGYHYKSNRTMPIFLTFNAQQPVSQVIVTTAEPADITAISSIVGGIVTSVDGNYVSVQRGVCWGLNPNPSFNDNYIEAGSGMGSFSVSMIGLMPDTTYYVRAYAITTVGTIYGEQQSFTTRNGIPTLTTTDIINIVGTKATGGGNITDNGGMNITARGICWSTNPNPTISNNHTMDGTETGSFTSRMVGLTSNMTYYVRSYATTDAGAGYGNEVSFTTLPIPNGTINGLFTINENGDQVYFSQGNLQYIGSAVTPYWKFADDQWEFYGTDGQSSNSPFIDRDLFGWGTSGFDHGAVCYQPWSHSESDHDYYAYGESWADLCYSTGQADWGYNAIVNGGNVENNWRTLQSYEWGYLLTVRSTISGIRYAKAVVGGINGLIILPDAWSDSLYFLDSPNSANARFNTNIISIVDWDGVFETNGAVFLPDNGYWSSTGYSSTSSCGAQRLLFSDSMLEWYSGQWYSVPHRYYQYSVRLVQEYQLNKAK